MAQLPFNPKVGVAVTGMRVIKSGRTTGVTTGMVIATRVNGVQVNYGSSASPRIALFNCVHNMIEGFHIPGRPATPEPPKLAQLAASLHHKNVLRTSLTTTKEGAWALLVIVKPHTSVLYRDSI